MLSVPTDADAHKAFDAVADGGSIQLPLSKTLASPCFGLVTDRFGLGWMITVPQAPADR
jgi:PhnB protein